MEEDEQMSLDDLAKIVAMEGRPSGPKFVTFTRNDSKTNPEPHNSIFPSYTRGHVESAFKEFERQHGPYGPLVTIPTKKEIENFRRISLIPISANQYTEIVATMMAEMAGLLVGEPDIEKASEIFRTLQEVHERRHGVATAWADPDVRPDSSGDHDAEPLVMGREPLLDDDDTES